MLTLLLGDKIITKPTAQLNMMLLHMAICLSEVNLTLFLLKQFYLFESTNKRHRENENGNVYKCYSIYFDICYNTYTDHDNDFSTALFLVKI